ncbi:hypothetical protein B4098_0761 [Heyndrickxia coagulans]|uniref:Uncharacterized protein n=1 Tax=Heyndrickxia coagulans TaxID=1398 RepID=A0A150JU55_HEYCO|nr:hypothetical protein B4098_0761 [Heyndrickxia coagulans]
MVFIRFIHQVLHLVCHKAETGGAQAFAAFSIKSLHFTF